MNKLMLAGLVSIWQFLILEKFPALPRRQKYYSAAVSTKSGHRLWSVPAGGQALLRVK